MMGLAAWFVLIGYFFLAKSVSQSVEKKTGSKKAKYVAIAVFVLIPTWDIIPGYLYFNHLCEKEAGVKVFKTVEVDRAYFMANGQPDEKKLTDHYGSTFKVDRDFSSLFHIAKIESALQDKRTGEILGTAADLTYYGGWLNSLLFQQGLSTTCPAYPVHTVKWKEMIKPKPDIPNGRN